jgi:hypothetical protein
MDHNKAFGPTVGPLGFPMLDKQARVLDTLLKSLPKTKDHEYKHQVTTKAPTELNPGERSDVSWISTESVDRQGEVVIAKGMNDAQFQGNPLVTLQHAYYLPPVGKSLWRKRTKDGDFVGIKAKTQYPNKPADWNDAWPPDQILQLIQAGLLQGKSIGFLPTKVHIPDEKEVKKNGWSNDVSLVIDEWLLLEYACVFLPANQDALVDQVSKGLSLQTDVLQALGIKEFAASPPPGQPPSAPVTPFTTLEEIEKAMAGMVALLDLENIIQKTVQDSFTKAQGRV